MISSNFDLWDRIPFSISGTPSSGPNLELDVRDLELLHHFTTVTYLTMSNVAEEQKLWQGTIIKIGLQHTFLLRGILALSALHLSYLDPQQSSRYLILSSSHRDISLAQFRRALNSVDLSSYEAVFALSGVIPIHSLAAATSVNHLDQSSDLDILSSFLESTTLLRGINLLLLPYWDIFFESRIKTLLRVALAEGYQTFLYPGMESLDQLQLACETIYASNQPSIQSNKATTYSNAISELRTTFARFFDTSATHFLAGIALLWTLRFSDDYYLLLKERDHGALAIFAHFAVLLSRLNHVWWLRGLGSSLIESVSGILGDSTRWGKVMQWPNSVKGDTQL